MLPHSIDSNLKERFGILDAKAIGGGCINDCYRIKTSKGNFFLKLNGAKAFPGMFEAEAKGLKLLASTNTLSVPYVFEAGQVNGTSFLLMEFIHQGQFRQNTMRDLGKSLAALHKHSSEYFGLAYDNYIGSIQQHNELRKSWAEFFVEMRLQPLIELAENKNLHSTSILNDFEKLFAKVDSLLPIEKPSLLHGDLWSGNYVIDNNGTAYIVDPAVYYGHREMDIAMSKLFGGFTNDFYEGYEEVYPLQKDWQQRIDLCNLYPLLVHINLFGGVYASQLKRCLSKFI